MTSPGQSSVSRDGDCVAARPWRILLLTCRSPETDFRLPLAEALQEAGHEVAYVFVKRRPVLVEMHAPTVQREFSLAGFLLHAILTFRPASRLLVFNSTNLVFPRLSRMLRRLVGGVWCFDMHDDLLYNSVGARRAGLEKAQARLLAGSDLVVHAAPALAEMFPASHHLGNASNLGPIERSGEGAERLLILASLDERFDFDFLSRTAGLHTHLGFDIFGQISEGDPAVMAKVEALRSERPNVSYRGAYVNADLPAILAAYRVTLAPYVTQSRSTRYIDPLRFYHCLNSGMEVVSTDIPGARHLAEHLHIVRSPEEVGSLMARLAAGEGLRNAAARHATTWGDRALQLMRIVEDGPKGIETRGATPRASARSGGGPAMPHTIVVYLPDLSGGGAERLHLRLASEWRDAGAKVLFLLDRGQGELMDAVPPGCDVEILGAGRQLAALPKLVDYLRREKPDTLISNMEHMNVMTVLAKTLARSKTKVIVTQHIALSGQVERPAWQWRHLPKIYRHALSHADAIVAVSGGVAKDLAENAGVPRSRIEVIYNGVVTSDFDERASAEPDHRWFREPAPVIVAMGRMVPQKDFGGLIEAFAQLVKQMPARLLILGDGPLRPELSAQVRSLGLEDLVDMPGFVQNPLPFLRRAGVFVLSSRFEGFGNVLAEALACGTPCVSTDCPHGPAEILEHGRYGRLVPIGDPRSLADAMRQSLQDPFDPAASRMRGRDFGVARCAELYLELAKTTHDRARA